MTQPKLHPDHPVVEVKAAAPTYADLARTAIRAVEPVLGDGPLVAVVVGTPRVEPRPCENGDTRTIVVATMHVGTPWETR